MGTTYENIYHWTMPDGSQVTTNSDTPPEGWVNPNQPVAQGISSLPQGFSPQYGWANPMAGQAAPQVVPQQPVGQGPQAILPQTGMNPIQLMSQFGGYSSPSQLMSMEAGALKPEGPSWKI